MSNKIYLSQAVPWLRPLVCGLLRWKLGFDPRPVHVRLVVDKMAQEQAFLPVLLLPLSVLFCSISAPCFYQKDKRAKARDFGNIMRLQTWGRAGQKGISAFPTFLALHLQPGAGRETSRQDSLQEPVGSLHIPRCEQLYLDTATHGNVVRPAY
jgi:hypothetical protein